MPQKLVTVAAPAAGADWTVTVPAGEYWVVIAANAQLVTDANVAARGPKLAFDAGAAADTFYETGNSGTGQAASTTKQYSFGPGCAMETASPASGVFSTFPLPVAPPAMILFPGYRIRMITGAIQVGDQWSNIRLLVMSETMEQTLRKMQ